MALHWYGTDVGNFIAYINDYHYTFNLSVWVTEWACQVCELNSYLSTARAVERVSLELRGHKSTVLYRRYRIVHESDAGLHGPDRLGRTIFMVWSHDQDAGWRELGTYL